ncbi:MAG: hypothetical protein AAF329_15185 [Cyanobacteria bacterium P01_A01_bin.17]
MAVSGAAIQILGAILRYAIPLVGSPANKYVIPLEITAGQPVIFYFQEAPYQATITLSQEFNDYVFTPGGGPRQIVIGAQGGGDINGQVTFIVPQSIRPYIASGEIVIEGQSANFVPSNAPQHLASWLPSDASSLTNGGFPVVSQGSSTVELRETSKGPITIADGVIQARATSIDIAPPIVSADSDNCLYVCVVSDLVMSGNDPIFLRTGSSDNNVIRNDPFANRNWNYQGFYWEGQWDSASGNDQPILHTNGDYLGGSGGIPGSTWTYFIVRGRGGD